MEKTVCVKSARRKCAACGKEREGKMIKSLRYENLAPIFLCFDCINFLKDEKEEKK